MRKLELYGSSPSNDDAESDGPTSLYESANCLSRILVSWLSPLLKVGYQRPLEASDLPALSSGFISSHLDEKLSKAWNARKEGSGNYRLFCACLDVFGGPFYRAGFLKFIGDVCALSSPLLLSMIITDLKSGGSSLTGGLSLCFGIFLLQMINTLAVNTYFTITMQTGMKVRSATSALVYTKALRLSGKARQGFSTGQIVNLMSTDGTRLDMAASYLHYVWSGPFQGIVIIILLFKLLKWAAFVGLGILLLVIPIQSKITTLLSKYRKQTSTITDKRVRLMQEIIQGIRVIKFYAWEQSFLGKLFELRERELNRVGKAQVIRSMMLVMTSFTSIFSCIITFLTYHWLGHKLTPEVVFPALALFNLLRLPLVLLPMVISMAVDGSVAIRRMQKFLLADELDFFPIVEFDSKYGVVIENGSFVWETSPKDTSKDASPLIAKPEPISRPIEPVSTTNLIIPDLSPGPSTPQPSQTCAVDNINLIIPKGNLTAIVGPVGSGKSSLLNAIIGELKCVNGVVRVGGRIAYSPQQAWIQNATVRDNILFGNPFDARRYEEIIAACALKPDFDMFPDGDMTEIGEKGVNISGGQKQRISLARAAYSDADIILMDDPLSAVDAHVGKHLLEYCLNGCMLGRTRILVTHQLYILPAVDQVILMDNGRIVEQGTFGLLMRNNEGNFQKLMVKYGGIKDYNSNSQKILKEASRPSTPAKNPDSTQLSFSTANLTLRPTIASEERFVGAVEWSVYKEYIVAAGGVLFVVASLGSVIAWNITRAITDYWIAMWTSEKPVIEVTASIFIGIYLALGIVQGFLAASSSLSFSWGGIKAARRLHNQAVHKVLHAPVSFFDTNPTGRIINRFSKDQDTLDNLMIETLRSFVHTLNLTAFTFLTMVLVDVFFSLPLVLLLGLYYGVQRYYRASSREMKRLESLSRSPLFAQFSETLTGLPTVRAFAQQSRFIRRNQRLMDANNRASFVQTSIQRWLGVRLETIGNVIILSASSCCYIFAVPPALAGLTISYALSVTSTMNWCIRQFADTETQIISSERLGYYATKLPQEATPDIPTSIEGISSQWPSKGAIEMKNLCMRYRPDLPPVLNDINLSIKAGERIGIVGRTGAGKSSIMQALFRIVEASEGSIFIDGVDIAALDLELLRSKLSIIPQDPVVFEGKVRWNLDPTSRHSDQELWSALERAHLKEVIVRLGGLDAAIQEGGDNLSVGQRQLLCLARAILRRNCILVLDEATANIDLATDALIQKSIRQDFIGCTILTIAHRISTVIDYDKILVLDKGKVAEFDTPRNLLNKLDGHFVALVEETGDNKNEVIFKSITMNNVLES